MTRSINQMQARSNYVHEERFTNAIATKCEKLLSLIIGTGFPIEVSRAVRFVTFFIVLLGAYRWYQPLNLVSHSEWTSEPRLL